MHNKLEIVRPPELVEVFLSNPPLSELIQTSYNINKLFQPLLKDRKLLPNAVHGVETAVRKQLKKNFYLALKKMRVTNLSGQKFEHISFSQYVLATLNEPMLEILIALIPNTEWGMKFLAQLIPQYKVSRLLYHVVRGNHDAVRALLKEDIDLLLQEGIVIDCSGRLFRKISALQYAFWALDEPMWKTLLACVKESEKRKELLPKCFAVYQAFCPQLPEEKEERTAPQAVSFELQGNPVTQFHYDFDEIINALQEQVNPYNEPGEKDWDLINTQWQKGVGGAQKLLPMHVVNEYCCPYRPFYPPDFTINPGSSKQFFNWLTQEYEDWFHIDSELGVNFAIAWGNCGQPATSSISMESPIHSCREDLAALTALFEARKKAFIDLKTQFIKSMAVEGLPLTVHTM